jgi:membrane-bound ClpP family serine protease
MRDAVPPMIDSIWRENASEFRPAADAVPDTGAEAVLYAFQQLAPHDDGQRAKRDRALQVGLEVAKIQLLLFAQPANAISAPFITVLVLWLAFIFAIFSLYAPANTLIVVVLLVCALAASSAIFLILDLDSPFAGLLQIPSAPLRNALPSLGSAT